MTTTELRTLSASSLADASATLPFPPRREKVRALWQPIYLEPMIGSGERICVGVAVANAEGYRVVPASGLERFECLYGKAGSDFVRQIIEATCDSLARALEQPRGHDAFADAATWSQFWTPPLQGFSTGAPNFGAGDNLEEIARNGLSLCASLVEKAVDNSEENQAALTRTQFQNEVREAVLRKRPSLEPHFSKTRKLGDNVLPIRFGFVGFELAANFVTLRPHTLSENVDWAKSRIWDLHNLQQAFDDDLFSAGRTHFNLFVQMPATNSPSYSLSQLKSLDSARGLLEIVAKDNKVSLFPSDSVNTIADELIQKEAA